MDSGDFRRYALELEGVVEAAHMNHPDFRVGGRIFATLNRDETAGMVKLRPEQQDLYVLRFPEVFSACAGAWGRGGSTYVKLAAADDRTVKDVLLLAWMNCREATRKKG